MQDSTITLGEYLPIRRSLRSGRSKLDTAQRTEIGYLRWEGFTGKDIAAEYGVSTGTVYGIAPVPRP